MQEVLVDPFGNVVPPPAAEQYSPPAAHIQDRADWVPPPPLPPYFGTPLSPMPPFPPHPQTPYMPPPVSFPTGGLMMMPMYVGHPMSSSHMVPPVSQPPLPPFPAQMGGVFPAPPASRISPDPVDGLLPVSGRFSPTCPAEGRQYKRWVSIVPRCGTLTLTPSDTLTRLRHRVQTKNQSRSDSRTSVLQ